MGEIVTHEFLSRRLHQIKPFHGVETTEFHADSQEFFTVATIRFNQEIYTRVIRVADRNTIHFVGATDIHTALDDGAALLIPMDGYPKDST